MNDKSIKNAPQKIDKQMVDRLHVLAQATRLSIFRLLAAAGFVGMDSQSIRLALAISPSSLSFHLRVLRQSHLIYLRQEGRSTYYVANVTLMRSIIGYLNDYCVVPD